jgi:ribosomal protein S18 acetylase RimI-like enzyme
LLAVSTAPIIRPATPDDRELVERTLFTALAWDPEDPIPPMDVVIAHPKIAVYHDGWMRQGDAGVVAEIDGEFAGMAYCRIFEDGSDSQGFYDAETPELAVGVEAAHRGRGIGEGLITALHEMIAADGVARMSLSVDTRNPAMRLYERLGYQRVRGTDSDAVMVLTF